MNKVKTLDDLRKMRETLRSTLDIREYECPQVANQ